MPGAGARLPPPTACASSCLCAPVHAGPNPKYFGIGRGVTYYNLVSNQFTGLHGITVPGTLRDSLVLLAVVLEQQTELQPTQIMTDTGAYSDVVFGLFRLLGYRFSPRLADIGGTRFWRIDPHADYGTLNSLARQCVKLDRITPHWDDMLRTVGSLKLGRVPATGIMRTLQVGDRPTRLAQAIAEYGRIDKTLHTLTYIDDEAKRRATLIQLNRGEGRHSLARAVFHGKRGELRQRYREGQEDQLGALGLVVNVIVLWNTIYMQAALEQLRAEDYPCARRMSCAYRRSATSTSTCWGGTRSPCPNRSPGASSGPSETPLTAIVNRTFGSTAPQTPIIRKNPSS